MHIGDLRISRYADRPDPPFPAQTKAQHHNQRQRQAVRPQLHGLPAIGLIPQLPAIGIAAQSAKSHSVSQQNLPWQRPNPMKQTGKSPEQAGPEWNRKQKQSTQCERLGQQIRRQQLPRGMPAAFERITWAGHGPESCEPCAATPGLQTRCAP